MAGIPLITRTCARAHTGGKPPDRSRSGLRPEKSAPKRKLQRTGSDAAPGATSSTYAAASSEPNAVVFIADSADSSTSAPGSDGSPVIVSTVCVHFWYKYP